MSQNFHIQLSETHDIIETDYYIEYKGHEDTICYVKPKGFNFIGTYDDYRYLCIKCAIGDVETVKDIINGMGYEYVKEKSIQLYTYFLVDRELSKYTIYNSRGRMERDFLGINVKNNTNEFLYEINSMDFIMYM